MFFALVVVELGVAVFGGAGAFEVIAEAGGAVRVGSVGLGAEAYPGAEFAADA